MNKTLLKNQSFRHIFAGEAISQLGTGLTYIAVMAKFLELNGSTSGWAYILALKAVPFLLLGWLAGYAADRFNPKLLLIVSHALRCLIYLCMAFCQNANLFYILVFMSSVFDALYIPAYKSLITRLLDKTLLLGANSLEETVRSSVAIMGIACSGLLIGWGGLQTCFVVDAATYGLAGVNLLLLNRLSLKMNENPGPMANLKQELGRGFSAICSQNVIHYPIFLSLFLTFLIGFEMPMFLPLAIEKGWNGAVATGYLYASASVGSLLTSLILLKHRESPIRHAWLVSLIILADAATLLGIVLSIRLPMALSIAFGLGITETLFRIYAVTEIQRNISTNMIGRVFASLAAVQEPVKIVSMMFSGLVVSLLTAHKGFYIAAGIEVAVGLASLLLTCLSLYKNASKRRLITPSAQID